jgi:hypothetical protein
MPFSIRPHRRFLVQCAVTYNGGPFQGQGTVWNFSLTGWRVAKSSSTALSCWLPLPIAGDFRYY